MAYVEVSTQEELDRVKPGDIAVVREGRFVARGSSHVVAWGSSHVVAWGSSHVEAWGSSHVVAWGSSHVEAWGSSHVEARGSSHVEAWDSSHVVAWDSSHVVAWGSSHVVARDSSHVEASKFVATHRLSTSADVRGGVIIDVRINTPQDWCDFHGIEVTDGRAVLFKAVDDDWQGSHKVAGITYAPGDEPSAPDWDEAPRCGGGLHLSPHPRRARDYHRDATRFVACEVDLGSMVLLDDKVKVRSCRVLHEVDLNGERIGVAA